MARRDWSAAWEKVNDEDGQCRKCKSREIVEPAHLWSRGNGGDDSPENIVPLCRTCHERFDGNDRTFDLLPYLTGPEVAQVVHLAASTTNTNGLELARMRLCPRDYAKPIEDARQLAAIDEASAPSCGAPNPRPLSEKEWRLYEALDSAAERRSR